MIESKYFITIKFKSNESPFSSTYNPYRPLKDDLMAIEWARGMRENLLEYNVTLFKDGAVLAIDHD